MIFTKNKFKMTTFNSLLSSFCLKMTLNSVWRWLWILSEDDFEIKSKIYSLKLRLVLNYILNSQDVLYFRNLFFTSYQIKTGWSRHLYAPNTYDKSFYYMHGSRQYEKKGKGRDIQKLFQFILSWFIFEEFLYIFVVLNFFVV